LSTFFKPLGIVKSSNSRSHQELYFSVPEPRVEFLSVLLRNLRRRKFRRAFINNHPFVKDYAHCRTIIVCVVCK
jgi:hypothetical protein